MTKTEATRTPGLVAMMRLWHDVNGGYSSRVGSPGDSDLACRADAAWLVVVTCLTEYRNIRHQPLNSAAALTVLVLRYEHGMTFAEIGKRMGIKHPESLRVKLIHTLRHLHSHCDAIGSALTQDFDDMLTPKTGRKIA